MDKCLFNGFWWRIGQDTDRWYELTEASRSTTKPTKSFLFMAVDPLTPETVWNAEKYWLRAGTQVEVCSVDENDFTIDLIAFDANSMGLVVVDELKFIGGQLCIEHPPPIPTTIDPPTVAHMFGLQPKPLLGANEYRLSLECDFTIDHCNQWLGLNSKS
ncbi:unnamed protein product, partial [Mesorhabditis belari]|uniref:Uncharacterized protein n=1 Tax=Mesorhabditis belari TaxID=2138241 RepID=A0AAF3FLU9_9BILA